MALLARIETQDAEERGNRRYRLRLNSPGQLGPVGADVTVHELSASGFLIETTAPLQVGETLSLMLPVAGQVSGEIVWGSSAFFGGQFRQDLPREAVTAALAASRVVWPEFTASSAADRGPGHSLEAAIASGMATPEIGTPPLPFGTRLQIIAGVSALLWSLIAATGWLLFQAMR